MQAVFVSEFIPAPAKPCLSCFSSEYAYEARASVWKFHFPGKFKNFQGIHKFPDILNFSSRATKRIW